MQLTFMDPGQLRTEIVIKNPVETPDGSGGFVVTYQDGGTVWALVDTLSSRLDNFGAREIDEASHRIVVRFRDDLKPGQRLSRLNTNYTIKMVKDLDGTSRYLSCFILEDRN
jgi:SPP1 family predicted phage head-tail adaptor